VLVQHPESAHKSGSTFTSMLHATRSHRTKFPALLTLQIGRHFSKWGRVMDVVMVKDFGPLLSLAETATHLEQQRKAAESKPAHGKRAGRRAEVWMLPSCRVHRSSSVYTFCRTACMSEPP
jgi:hypothetical protein